MSWTYRTLYKRILAAIDEPEFAGVNDQTPWKTVKNQFEALVLAEAMGTKHPKGNLDKSEPEHDPVTGSPVA